MVLALALCAVRGFSAYTAGKATGNGSSLTVLNYGDYIERDVLDDFEEQTGIQVIYEEYETPETMYTKYKSGSIHYDLICSSDYMVEKLIGEGEVLPIDFSNIPNRRYINEDYYRYSESFDPQRALTVPYFAGTVGLLYNTKYVDEADMTSWNALWQKKYANQIIMENSVRDSLIPALTLCGYSINTVEDGKLQEALQRLEEHKALNYAYLSDDAMYEMIMENANLALIYSGEANAAMLENENLAYSVPKEGSNLWIDSWFIPKTCRHKPEAEAFLNFICDPEMAYASWDHVYYTTPNTGVYDMLDEEEQADETMFPPKDVLERCEVFHALPDEAIQRYNELWKQLKVY